MAYLKTILTIQDRKTFWVLKIIDLQQGKHSLNHHTGVKSKEQIVGIQSQPSQTILFRDVWREYDEPNVKPGYYRVMWSVTQPQTHQRSA